MKAPILSTLALSFLAAVGTASATTIQTSSYSAWVATLTGSPTEANLYFGSSSYSNSTGWSSSMGSYGTFTVTGPDGGGYSLTTITGYSSSNLSGLVGASDGSGGIAVSAPSGATGILVGIGLTGNASPVTIVLSDGESFVVNPPVNGTALIGFSSSAPITSVYVTSSAGSAVVLDDLWAGVSNVPASSGPSAPASECATILLISGGLVFLGAKRKIFSNLSSSQALPAR